MWNPFKKKIKDGPIKTYYSDGTIQSECTMEKWKD